MTRFTQEQYDNINNAFSNNDRTRAYIYIYEYTDCSVAKDMSQISHFSGIIGGMAEKANEFAKEYGGHYPPEGVENFSKKVAGSVKEYITKIYKNGLEISNEGLLDAAQEAWHREGIKYNFPGNLLIAYYAVLKGDLEKAGMFFSKGTLFTLLSMPGSPYSGKELYDFMGPEYNIHINEKVDLFYVTDKDDKVVFTQDLAGLNYAINRDNYYDYLQLSVGIGVEAIFDAHSRELVASAQNAESSANNFGRGNPSNWASGAPAFVPTKGPSNGASSTPTFVPTKGPTGGPSGGPSAGGSGHGYVVQNYNNPFTGPNFQPTLSPSNKFSTPSINPSFNPTILPLSSPSYNPTASPLLNPSLSRTSSSAPLFSPTKAPIVSTSSMPLFSPTKAPVPSSGRLGGDSPGYNPISSPNYLSFSFNPFGYYANSNSWYTYGNNNRPTPLPLFNSPISSSSNIYRIGDPIWLYSRDLSNPSYQQYSTIKSSFTTSFTTQDLSRPLGLSSLNNYLNVAGSAINAHLRAMPHYGQTGYAYTQNGYGPAMPAFNAAMMAHFRNGASIKGGSYQWTQALQGAVRYAVTRVSPLVLDLDGDGIELLSYKTGVYFDIDNDGYAEKIGWTKPDDGQLARDINRNGIIDDITELFGDDLISAFFKLSLLDSNDDGIIDKNDKNFKELLIWQDKNSNGFSEADELKTLEEMGIKSISLKTKSEAREIEGNSISELAIFTYEDGREYEIADVHYHNDDMDSGYQGKSTIVAHKNNGFKKILQQFRKQIFKLLNEKIANSKEFRQEGDWVAKLIKQHVEDFITKYRNEKETKAEKTLDNANILFAKKAIENEQRYEQLRQKLIIELNELKTIAGQEAKDALLKELQAKLNSEIEVLQSKDIQERNAKIEEFKGNTNNPNIVQAAKEWSEAQSKKLNEEIAALQQKYQKLFNEEAERLDHEGAIQYISELTEKIHMNKYLSTQERAGLLELIQDQHFKKKAALDKFIIDLTEAVKKEANKLYEFVLKEAEFIMDEAKRNEEEAQQAKNEEAKQTESKSQGYYDYFVSFFQTKTTPIDKKFFTTRANKFLNENYFTSSQNGSNTFENSRKFSGVEIDPETLFMPIMRGHGKIPSLHIAMTLDPALKTDILDIMLIKPSELIDLQEKVMNILYRWAGVTNIHQDAKSMAAGGNIEARKVAFVEAITGQEFKQLGAAKFVGQHASTSVQKAWDIALMRATKNLLVQGPLMGIFPKAEYLFIDDKIIFNNSLDEILALAQNYAKLHLLKYDFWIQLGYILASSIEELKISIESLRAKLSDLAGEEILVDFENFSLIGNNLDNHIKGTSGSDYINGRGGNDKLKGFDSSDYIEGEDGDDELYGGDGIDRLYGGNGNDKIYGGEDRDFIYGGDGNDTIYGEEGDDIIEGGSGADYMDGGVGKNTISYGESKGSINVNLATGQASGADAEGDQFKSFTHLGGSEYDDILIGDDQGNEINGEGGNDKIYGGKGNDHLFGATGEDYLYGEEGDDHLTGFEGIDHMDGGDGIDTVSYHHPYSTIGVKVDLSTAKGIGGYAHGDTYINIENVKGSKFDDVIIGDDQNNRLDGVDGDDIIHGRGGKDIIIDLYGRNTLYGGDGDDLIVSGGNNVCFGGNGTDTISYEVISTGVNIDMKTGITVVGHHQDKFSEFENVRGTRHDDVITGDDKNNVIDPGDGDDKVFAGKGNDRIIGSLGEDFYDGGEGLDAVDYSQEPDRALNLNLQTKEMTGATFAKGDVLKNIEIIIATKFNDIMIGDDQDNLLYGFDGDDEIHGGDGNDYIVGGKGKNKLYGNDGSDVFEIGEGENLVYGGFGVNTIHYKEAKSGIEVDLSQKHGKKSTGEIDSFEDVHYCTGSNYHDRIIGDGDANHLYGLDGDDYIDGGRGGDTISGGNGNNTLLGSSGNDKFLLLDGSNIVDGGGDIDTVSYDAYLGSDYLDAFTSEYYIRKRINLLPSFSGQEFTDPITPQIKGVIVNLETGTAEKPNGLKDTLTNIENIDGTHYDDIITGDDNDNILNGSNGDDIIYGGKGDDIISSGRGHSELHGGEGNDIFKINIGTADVYGGEGNDAASFNGYLNAVEVNLEQGVINYQDKQNCKLESIEAVNTTPFNDIVYDSKANNHVKTEAGDDIIYISDGNDIIESGDGNDTIYLSGAGEKRLLDGSGMDKYVIMPGFTSSGKTSVIITDFTINWDKIDLTNLANITGFNDLKFEQIVTTEGVLSYSYAIIHIEENKEIALLEVMLGKLNEDSFIFHD